MEEDVGQALRQDTAGQQDFEAHKSLVEQGSLMAQFAAIRDTASDALPEIDEQMLSKNVEDFLQKFERAEYSLGHTLDEPGAIDSAFLSNSENVISIFDHHNFQYSLKETAHEQDSATETGTQLDENQVTDIGRLKIGIQDTAHEDRNRKKTEESARFARFLTDQQQYIAQLEEQMEALRLEIEELNEEIMALDELQALLEEGDLNEDTQSGASRRKKADSLLSKAGLSVEDFKTPDGRYNQDAMRQAAEDATIQKQAELAIKETELEKLEVLHQEAVKNMPADKLEDRSETHLSAVSEKYGEASVISSMTNEELNDTSFGSNDDWDSDWSDDWDSANDEQYSVDTNNNETNKEDLAQATYGNVVHLKTEEASRVYGSVAADDTERNVISSAFAMAASGETAPATPATPDVTQDQNYVQEQRINQTYGMA